MFGNFEQTFGLPAFPMEGMDPQGGLFGANFAPSSDATQNAGPALSLPGPETMPTGGTPPAGGLPPAALTPSLGAPSPLSAGALAPGAGLAQPTGDQIAAPAAGIGSQFGKPNV